MKRVGKEYGRDKHKKIEIKEVNVKRIDSKENLKERDDKMAKRKDEKKKRIAG